MKNITSLVAPNGSDFMFMWGRAQSVLAILDDRGELYHFFVLHANTEKEAVAVGRRWIARTFLSA